MNWGAAESTGVCTITVSFTVATCCTGNAGGTGADNGGGGGKGGGEDGASAAAAAGSEAGNCSGPAITSDSCAGTAADCNIISTSAASGVEEIFHLAPASNANTGTCNKSDTSKPQSKGLRMTLRMIFVGRSFIRIPDMAACRTVDRIIGRPPKRIQRAASSGSATLLRKVGWLILRAFDSQPKLRLFTSLSL